MNSRQSVPASPIIKHRRVSPLKAIALMLASLLFLCLVVYTGVAFYFSGRFMPQTTAANINFSFMTSSEAEEALNKKLNSYTLTISGRGFELELSSAQAGLAVNTSAIIEDMFRDVNPWLWPVQISAQHDESDKLVTESRGTVLQDTVQEAVETFNAEADAPTNATISYDSSAGAFVIVPETTGTALDANAIVQTAQTALKTLARRVSVTDEHLLQPTVFSTDERLQTAIDGANSMASANLSLTLDGYPACTIDGGLIAPWITVDDEVSATLNDEALSAWLGQMAKETNTVGGLRTYTRPDGKEITVKGGVYGWEIDQEALHGLIKDNVVAGNTATIEIPTLTYGTAYNGPHAQDWDNRYLDIDLGEQHARLYDDAVLVWESDIISGIPDGEHDTPDGVYWLNRKESPSTLKGYSGDTVIYETEVQYWMPFVGGAIGLHDADWQTSGFGGSLYASGLGSHGCVNLPPDKAAELYGLIREGDVVVCHW